MGEDFGSSNLKHPFKLHYYNLFRLIYRIDYGCDVASNKFCVQCTMETKTIRLTAFIKFDFDK